jgi:CMP-N,N'-diacetyllegionaminic acid synthase
MDTLFLITARGGSKGVPGKNIKLLNSKPLICYSIDVARKFVPDQFICVSTDDELIIETVQNYGLTVPFVRPSELSTDTTGSYDVIKHALQFYNQQHSIKKVVLLQPTSPFRLVKHVKEAIDCFNKGIDAVISVKKTHANPYQLLYIENKEGYIEKIINGDSFERRQDLPIVYELNGAIYVFNADSLLEKKISEFKKVKQYLMPELNSVDIDTPLDWMWAEFLLEKQVIHLDYE